MAIFTLFDEETNPVDKIIMKVLYRKQDQIRKSLGIYIPIADNDSSLMESIMEEIIVLDTKNTSFISLHCLIWMSSRRPPRNMTSVSSVQ